MDNQTIIVKKIKKGGHAHHGGAWKVAFADFVTAMMAFFLLLWLLAAATPAQLAGISSYFIDPIEHETAAKATSSMIDLGGTKDAPKGQDGEAFKEDSGGAPSKIVVLDSIQQEQARMASLMTELRETIENSKALKPFKEQLLLDITEEGLRIQVVDKENRPMFDSGSAHLKGYTREILHELAKVIQKAPNKISLTGHTDAVPFLDESREEPYTNWELSADRANASRRELIAGGLSEGKVAKVVGLASIVPFDKQNPRSPSNRRIAIIVLNKATEAALLSDGIRADTEEQIPAVQEDEVIMPAEVSIPGTIDKMPAATAPVIEPKKPAPELKPVSRPEPEKKKQPSARKESARKPAPAVDLPPQRDQASPVEDILPIIDPINLPSTTLATESKKPAPELKPVSRQEPEKKKQAPAKKVPARKESPRKPVPVVDLPPQSDQASPVEDVMPIIDPINLPSIPGG